MWRSIPFHSENTNPAEHLLDTITPDLDADNSVRQQKLQLLAVNEKRLTELYKHSNDQVSIDMQSSYAADAKAPQGRNQIPWINQFSILVRRGIREQVRRKGLLFTQLCQSIIMAVLIGCAFLNIGTGQLSLTKRQPVLFFCVINQGIFGAMQVINSFPAERILSLRERASGTYHASAYFMAKNAAELPFQMFQPMIFSCVAYFLIGLQPDAGKFFLFMFFIMLASTAATSLALMISAICRTTRVAVTVLPVALEIARLFGKSNIIIIIHKSEQRN
jgi:hypothetical protein